ncbi:MAG: ABC transporter permease [Anaerolineales bacterium]|nr:ABC transporter permease [Anaerolineales bacterium]
MRKILLIGFKDVTLAFRDRAALILMLAAPFVLTLGLGMVTGRFSGNSTSGVSDIPVVVVNQDAGDLGQALVDVLNSADLADLLAPTAAGDSAAARQAVDADEAAIAVIIPAGFTDSIIPPQGAAAADAVQIELYVNPTRPTSAGVVQAVVDEYLSRVEVGRVAGTVAVTQLVASGRIAPQAAAAAGQELGQRQAAEAAAPIRLQASTAGQAAQRFDVLAYLAPGMALMFLMYTVANGGRSLLTERAQGTLPRLLVSPTATAQVLAGKVFGIFLTGVAQMTILIAGSTLLFNLQWGDPLAVAALVGAAVVGATGWGLLITAIAKSPSQVSSLGSAIMLTFGILGGSFISLSTLPAWVQAISKITPNAWGLEGFTALALGGGLPEVALPIAALLVMGAVLFGAAVLLFNRQGLVQR